MRFFLNRIIACFKRVKPDAEIVGDVKFKSDGHPYFTVKMSGCQTMVDILAEDIIEKFLDKFHQRDIKNATKVFMKYRKLLSLISIEKEFAVLCNTQDQSYQLLDLSDKFLLRHIDFDIIKADDAFKLGMHFEKIRQDKDRKLFNLAKSGNNLLQLKLVKAND